MTSQFPFHDPELEALLTDLHAGARRDWWRLLPRVPHYAWASLRERLTATPGQHPVFRDVYSAVNEERGALLYLIARAIQAKRIVEFGSSFGISTLYLATAVRDNLRRCSSCHAQVIGSEIEPNKCAEAAKNLQAAGLSAIARIFQGNALETLAGVEAPLDLVFLDGRKDLYLPVLHLLKPKLRTGAVVVADNIRTFKKEVMSYVKYVRSGENGFTSSTLRISDGMEFSVRVARKLARDSRIG
jgi:predicted O-methyltransferase YrrM